MNDTILRQVAVLQANLNILKSQSDTISDLADMIELRKFETELTEYIALHHANGSFPADPLAVVSERIARLAEFFETAALESKRLLSFKQDWLVATPQVALDDLSNAQTEVEHLIEELPGISDRLFPYINEDDWLLADESTMLQPEIQWCAACIGNSGTPDEMNRCSELYLFSRGSGSLTDRVQEHFSSLQLRIEKLISRHAEHIVALVSIGAHVAKQDILSAERIIQSVGDFGFADLDYSPLSEFEKLRKIRHGFYDLKMTAGTRLARGEIKAVRTRMKQLRESGLIRGSELEQECVHFLNETQLEINSFLAAGKQRKMMISTVSSLVLLVVLATIFFVVRSGAKSRALEIDGKSALLRTFGSVRSDRIIELPLPDKSLITMIWCDPSAFPMGSSHSRFKLEKVTLSRGFWPGKTEVTEGQWKAVMGTSSIESSDIKFTNDNLPVVNVSGFGAKEFLKMMDHALSPPKGWSFSLPSEAQWQYACHAGKGGNNSSLSDLAWNMENSKSQIHPVATKAPNEWGFHDMYGNAWEWCSNYSGNGGVFASGKSYSGSDVAWAYRGGAWNSAAISFSRVSAHPHYCLPATGFRIALVISE